MPLWREALPKKLVIEEKKSNRNSLTALRDHHLNKLNKCFNPAFNNKENHAAAQTDDCSVIYCISHFGW